MRGIEEIEDPDRDVADPASRYGLLQISQSMVELQRDVAAIGTKTDRLISDVSTLRSELDGIKTSITWAKGFAAAALILIPICSAIIWWLVGDHLNRIRDQVLERPAPMASPSTPTSVAPATRSQP